jgi:hypothetical protein
MLSVEDEPPVDEVVGTGIVPRRLVELLGLVTSPAAKSRGGMGGDKYRYCIGRA